MANPFILYDSVFFNGTLSDTGAVSADTDYPIDNLADPRPYTLCKQASSGVSQFEADLGSGNSATVDAIGVVGHNLNTAGGKITPLFSSDASTFYPLPLLNPTAQNLVNRSEEFSYWSKIQSSVSDNVTTDPDGGSTADKLIDSVDSGAHYIYKPVLFAEDNYYTFSVYAKAADYDYVALKGATAAFNANDWAVFDLNSGSANLCSSASSTASASISDEGSGWYRCSLTCYCLTTALSYAYVLLSDDGSLSDYFFTGDGTSGVYIWGAQVVIGSTLTDYEVTTSDWKNYYEPSDDLAFVLQTAPATYRAFAVEIETSTSAAEIGVAGMSEMLDMQIGYGSGNLPWEEKTNLLSSNSQSGNLLGVSINSYEISIKHTFHYPLRTWVMGDYRTFYDNWGRYKKPFFYVPDIDVFTNDFFYVSFSSPKFGHPQKVLEYMQNLIIELEGIRQ